MKKNLAIFICLGLVFDARLNAMTTPAMKEEKTADATRVAMEKAQRTFDIAIQKAEKENDFQEALNYFFGKVKDFEALFRFDSHARCYIDSGVFWRFAPEIRSQARYYFAKAAYNCNQKYIVPQILRPFLGLWNRLEQPNWVLSPGQSEQVGKMWDECLPEEAKFEFEHVHKESEEILAEKEYDAEKTFRVLTSMARFFQPETEPRWFELLQVLPRNLQRQIRHDFWKIGSLYGKNLLDEFEKDIGKYKEGIWMFDLCYVFLNPKDQQKLLDRAITYSKGEPIGLSRLYMHYRQIMGAWLKVYDAAPIPLDPKIYCESKVSK